MHSARVELATAELQSQALLAASMPDFELPEDTSASTGAHDSGRVVDTDSHKEERGSYGSEAAAAQQERDDSIDLRHLSKRSSNTTAPAPAAAPRVTTGAATAPPLAALARDFTTQAEADAQASGAPDGANSLFAAPAREAEGEVLGFVAMNSFGRVKLVRLERMSSAGLQQAWFHPFLVTWLSFARAVAWLNRCCTMLVCCLLRHLPCARFSDSFWKICMHLD